MQLTYDDVIMNPFRSLFATNKLNNKEADEFLNEVIGNDWRREDHFMDTEVGPGDLYWNYRPNDLPCPHPE